MGKIPAGLDRQDKVAGGAPPPGSEFLPRRQPVKTVVVLYGQVMGGVVLKPQTLGYALGVKTAPPLTVLPARRPDQHWHRPYLPTGPGSTQNSFTFRVAHRRVAVVAPLPRIPASGMPPGSGSTGELVACVPVRPGTQVDHDRA